MLLVHDESAGDNYQEMATYANWQIIMTTVKFEKQIKQAQVANSWQLFLSSKITTKCTT